MLLLLLLVKSRSFPVEEHIDNGCSKFTHAYAFCCSTKKVAMKQSTVKDVIFYDSLIANSTSPTVLIECPCTTGNVCK